MSTLRLDGDRGSSVELRWVGEALVVRCDHPSFGAVSAAIRSREITRLIVFLTSNRVDHEEEA